MTLPHPIPAPGERFNFAQHLLQLNAAHPDRPAFIDDRGTLSYGRLADRVARLASGLRTLGLKREERVLLLMLDGNDWPVSFLGAMYAGLVPVAVNTLLTADDYAYMLEHSRAQAVLVSGALLPTLNAAMVKWDHEVCQVIVSQPTAPLHGAEQDFDAFVAAHAPMAKPAATGPDDPGFWLYSSGSTGRPKGTVHSHANPYWTAELYGKGVLGLRAGDVCFSAAKLFFAYGLGNALTFPMAVGATAVLMAERPTPASVFERLRAHQPTIFYGVPTLYASILADPANGRESASARLRACGYAVHTQTIPAEITPKNRLLFGDPGASGKRPGFPGRPSARRPSRCILARPARRQAHPVEGEYRQGDRDRGAPRRALAGRRARGRHRVPCAAA